MTEDAREFFFRQVLSLFLEGRLDEDRATRLLERAFQDAVAGIDSDYSRIIEDHLDD